ncbi:probable ethanolamine kinase isoform X3 [Vigna angularis]|uniref:probable ethanolamine kinase isoform X3 n=1 Tax=Phaseolus angularis TaxID=3914 RepID=UPI0022B30AE2|nr:probable ethanolamine kinase isoform X3 [Vigna angularis]
MGAEVKIWNPVEVAEQASHDYVSKIHPSQLTIDPSLELPHMTPLVLNMCKDMFKAWADLDDFCFDIEKISGGITNLLLKVSVKQENCIEEIITIRLYGPNTEYIIDRQRELQATKFITAAGFGAKWLGIFGNGMVQSFINAQTLSPSASVLKFDDSEIQKTYETISFKEIHDEIVELKGLCDLLKSPVIFAHNDLLSGNIMINYEEDKLYFIDYEYASYNYRGYDIGNHFAEYAGFDCDFDLYPNINEQYHFFRHYLQPERPHEVSEKDLEALYVEANTFSLASHVFWALWGVIQAKMSPIEFDYLGYFFLRYKEYKRQKEKYFLLARTYLTGCKNN